eukprot:20625-Eustigmatos_ZCMA.PRE.1
MPRPRVPYRNHDLSCRLSWKNDTMLHIVDKTNPRKYDALIRPAMTYCRSLSIHHKNSST